MRKRRKKGSAEPQRLFPRGWSAGYSQYRYGSKVRVSLPAVVSVGERDHLVRALAAAMEPWRCSRWEHEGDARAGLRSAFVLGGHDWHQSDATAEDIIRRAFNALGRGKETRPTWEQGQPSYVDGLENCHWCGGRLDDEARGGGRKYRYCSDICARSAFEFSAFEVRSESNRAYAAAHRLVRKSRTAERLCEQCGDPFHPVREASTQFYCSQVCRGKARRGPRKACATCGTLFRDVPGKVYCSQACYREGGVSATFVKHCQWCGVRFVSNSAKAMFCSKRHQQMFYRLPARIVAGKVRDLSPPVFDQVFRMAA